MVKVKVCVIDRSQPFIYEVHGEVSTKGLIQIENEIEDDFEGDFEIPPDVDWIECECTWDEGEFDEYGQYTVPPHWCIVWSASGVLRWETESS